MKRVRVIGAGLAGCEAAWSLANRGYGVELVEQKPLHYSPAHHVPTFAELVCSNSLKAERVESAAGLLKEEMRRLGSLCLQAAQEARVPAGGALAVNRDIFSDRVTQAIRGHENIQVVAKVQEDLSEQIPTILATGPLTEGAMARQLQELTGATSLSFFDAAAPIVTADSLDFSQLFAQSRYDRGGAEDYWNASFDKAGYEAFWEALVSAETATLHDFEENVYEGCMPIEKLAKRGKDAIRYGPMKPVGLRNPQTGHRPWAAVQLRKENEEGSLFNLVGFQTNLKFSEQKRVFSMIPGFANAEFARYGVMHRNSFLNAPEVLDEQLRLKKAPWVRVAGQLSGVEGYMESAAGGILAARFLAEELEGISFRPLPETTMLGALLKYLGTPNRDFQPMGANMGLLPALAEEIKDKKDRYAAYAQRALAALDTYLKEES